jgi:hypothetical protein
MANVTMIVPAQDWAMRFTELQVMFPPWALTLITNFPDCFTNMANCWVSIISEASRQAAGRKMGAGGRVLQLAANTMQVGELDGINDVAVVLYDYPPDWGAEFSGGIFALGRTPGCWRCGDPRYLRRDCPFPASQAERDGLPFSCFVSARTIKGIIIMNQWAKQPDTRPDMGAPRAMGVARVGVAPPAPPPIIDQVSGINDRLARQEALVEAVLARMTTSTSTSSAAGALLAPDHFIQRELRRQAR